MKIRLVGLLLLGSLALVGCKDDDKDLYAAKKPLDKMSNEEWCAFYAKYLANPRITPEARQLDLQRMRQRNCPMPG